MKEKEEYFIKYTQGYDNSCRHLSKTLKNVTVQPKNAYKLEFADHLWLQFLDQPQYDIVLFVIITFHLYNILLKNMEIWNMSSDIITFNEELGITFKINYRTS